jgi:hypothetical protein
MPQFNPHPVSQNGKPDLRYEIAREWCGYDKPRYVLRFCGDWVAQSISYAAVALRAVGHNAARLGAPVVVNQPA